MPKKLYKFLSRYGDNPSQTLEETSPTDFVDRSGYIPLDLQYERLMSAGKTLELQRDLEYNIDNAKIMAALDSDTVDFSDLVSDFMGRKLDKVEAHAILKEKLKKAREQVSYNKQIKKHYEDFQAKEKEKLLRKEIANQLKEEMAKQDNKV